MPPIGEVFVVAPETRDLFPVNMSTQRSRLLRALVYVVQMVDRPDELVTFLTQLFLGLRPDIMFLVERLPLRVRQGLRSASCPSGSCRDATTTHHRPRIARRR